jgi:hypothetical protein
MFALPSGMVFVMQVARTVLVIGDVALGAQPPEVKLVSLHYAELSAKTISAVLPDLVIMPLFGAGFDALDALARLERFGFRGDVLVRAPRLPNTQIVERELAAVAPKLTVRLTGPIS